MATLTPFFDLYPKIEYDITRTPFGSTETVTNIFHRLGYLREVLHNTSAYVLYEIQDNETPEIIAEKVYGDAGAGWMIIYANKILDPQFDWPMDADTFNRYIIAKYGSISAATQNAHHYEKVVETTVDDMTTVNVYPLSANRLTEEIPDQVFDWYLPYYVIRYNTVDSDYYTVDLTSLTADFSSNSSFTIATPGDIPKSGSYHDVYVNGKNVIEKTYGREVTFWDYELDLNENRRFIKVVKADFYAQIMGEFKTLVNDMPTYVRTFV